MPTCSGSVADGALTPIRLGAGHFAHHCRAHLPRQHRGNSNVKPGHDTRRPA